MHATIGTSNHHQGHVVIRLSDITIHVAPNGSATAYKTGGVVLNQNNRTLHAAVRAAEIHHGVDKPRGDGR